MPKRSYTSLTPKFLCSAVLIGLCGTLGINVAAKDFYKWQDDNGVTHYSAQPPKGRKTSTKVKAYNIYGNPKETKAPRQAQAATKTTPEVTRAPVDKDPGRCKAARENLKIMQENARVRIKDGDEIRYLNEKELSDKVDAAQKTIKEHC